MQTAKQQLEKLTHSWYGAAVFSSVIAFFTTSAGIIGSLIGLAVSFGITWFIGSRLLAGSGAMRMFCLVMSVLGLLGHSYGTYRAVMGPWGLQTLGVGAMAIIYIVLSFRSLRTLTSPTVREFFKA